MAAVVIRNLVLVLVWTTFLSVPVWSQSNNYQKKKLKEVDVTALFSFYSQDGIHSAITGGRGSEELNVYSINYDRSYKFDSIRNISFGLGFDYISSASTDRIDFRISSASEHDQRIYFNVGYAQEIKGTGWTVGGRYDFSTESDYYSAGFNLFGTYLSKERDLEIGVNLQVFNDDLRWRKNFFKPTTLIYPVELRDTMWFSNFKRLSINSSFSIRKDINRRMSIGFYPAIIYQRGLLSTPFHRVYFTESVDPRVERLPDSRIKIPLGVQLNQFLTPVLVSRLYYQYYWDNFSIRSHLINLSTPLKLTSFITITPSIRYYNQSAADYFRPYNRHDLGQEYYTSDFDLSQFTSWKIGLEFKSLSNKSIFKKKWIFDRFSIRYAYYSRSDGMNAHILSTVFDFSKSNVQSY